MKKNLIKWLVVLGVLAGGVNKINCCSSGKLEQKTEQKIVEPFPVTQEVNPSEKEYIKMKREVYNSIENKFRNNPKEFLRDNDLYLDSWTETYGKFPIPLPSAIANQTIETLKTFPINFSFSYLGRIKKPKDILDYNSFLNSLGESLSSPLIDIAADIQKLNIMHKDKIRNPWRFNEVDAVYFGERGFHIYPFF